MHVNEARRPQKEEEQERGNGKKGLESKRRFDPRIQNHPFVKVSLGAQFFLLFTASSSSSASFPHPIFPSKWREKEAQEEVIPAGFAFLAPPPPSPPMSPLSLPLLNTHSTSSSPFVAVRLASLFDPLGPLSGLS